MEKIIIKFSAQHSLIVSDSVVVVMTLDERVQNYKVKYEDLMGNKKELRPIPKRVLKAFTESAINKILEKDEIPNESGLMVLDGYSYDITITKGGIKKEYYANDVTIETYPLLRYLASWCRRR